ncbi:hypothetical protein NTGM5_390012 [Candidatus Nitrotoga sp. M5]|nr:hypothetical protein NTGM5_390012 [Candidatus Nitrotoga sp. M5]
MSNFEDCNKAQLAALLVNILRVTLNFIFRAAASHIALLKKFEFAEHP